MVWHVAPKYRRGTGKDVPMLAGAMQELCQLGTSVQAIELPNCHKSEIIAIVKFSDSFGAEAAMDAGTAWAVGHLDELWQAELWGKDPLAEAGHAERQADLGAAVSMLTLL